MRPRRVQLREQDVLSSRVITPIDVFVMDAIAAHPAGHYDDLLASRRVGHEGMLTPEPRQTAVAETSRGQQRLFMVVGEEEKVRRVFHEPPHTHRHN